MNIIVLAIKPMEPEEPRFPVRVEFNFGADDEIVSDSTITVEVWLDKANLARSPSPRSTTRQSTLPAGSLKKLWTQPRPPMS